MEILRNVSKWGNGAGVLLPKDWEGNQVRIILLNRTLEIKKEALNILSPYLDDVLGVYLTGSYARGEQEQDSDIDIIAISQNKKKEIVSGKYNVSLIPLELVKKTLEKNPLLILPRLAEAKTILNNSLLDELKNKMIQKSSFRDFVEECERVIRINEGLVNMDKEKGRSIDSAEIIYSLILRLRGVFLAKLLLEKKEYTKKEFLKWIGINSKEPIKLYDIYRSFKDNKKIKVKVKIEETERLLNLLKKGVEDLKDE